MPDLRRYVPGTRTRRRTRRPGTWGRGDGLHVRPRRRHPLLRANLAAAVLIAPSVYLAAGYGPGTAPVRAYLTGVLIGLLLRPALAIRGRR